VAEELVISSPPVIPLDQLQLAQQALETALALRTAVVQARR
jgi:hypothetical protein